MKELMIVGGGSAGWMTAIYLNKKFNKTSQNLKITVLESPDIGVIGVGEATVHAVRYFFASMGLDEEELMREANGTYKTGILFRNWMKPVKGEMHEYFHPFEQQHSGGAIDISSQWFLSEQWKKGRYDQAVSLSSALIKEGHGPKGANSPAYQGAVPYGYHIDAVLMSRFLRRKAVEGGVIHIEATVTDVTVEGGNITEIITGAGETYSADIFIDCTGFRGLLIEKLKEDNWVSFKDALPCTKAVALQREMPAGKVPRPYTTATALSNGWAWQIDLSNRQGTGYVYDGDKLTKEQAETELRDFLGDESEVIKCTHLDMKVGCRKDFWVGNCITVGLSAGFIEPLESTGLHLINLGVGLLSTHIMTDEITDDIRYSYSRLMTGFFEDLKQFIVLHYCLTDRDDTEFWQAAPATVDHCDWLKRQLKIWQNKICEYQDLAGSFSTTFSDENYRYILYGMQHYPKLNLTIDTEQSALNFKNIKEMAKNAVSITMPHGDYITRGEV
jgi:tryptophan halogenase